MPITLTQNTALITGSSRGIGRGIALKLAEHGVKRIAITYFENEAAANDTLRKVRDRGADGFAIKVDVGKLDDIKRMFAKVKADFRSLDIYVSNARANLASGFYQTPLEIPLENFQATYDSQVREFLVATREAVPLMGKNPGSSRSRTRPEAGQGAGNRGSRWAQQRPPRRLSRATLRWPSRRRGSPSTRSARAPATTASSAACRRRSSR